MGGFQGYLHDVTAGGAGVLIPADGVGPAYIGGFPVFAKDVVSPAKNKRPVYQGRYSELLEVEQVMGDEFRFVESDPVYGRRLTWLNKKTRIVMIEDSI